MVKFHNASVRHIKPSPPAGDFSVLFRGRKSGRFLAVVARSNLALIPDEEKQKKKKKKAIVVVVSEISPYFLKFFFVFVWGILVGFHVGGLVLCCGWSLILWRYDLTC